MTETETLRTAIRAALAALDAGGPTNTAEARNLLREGLATPREAHQPWCRTWQQGDGETGLEGRGA